MFGPLADQEERPNQVSRPHDRGCLRNPPHNHEVYCRIHDPSTDGLTIRREWAAIDDFGSGRSATPAVEVTVHL